MFLILMWGCCKSALSCRLRLFAAVSFLCILSLCIYMSDYIGKVTEMRAKTIGKKYKKIVKKIKSLPKIKLVFTRQSTTIGSD